MPSIILIHDSPDVREMLCLLLAEAGYTVAACPPVAAAPLIRRAPPDLIILDISPLQATIGWTVLDSLQTDPTTAPIPLLVCSTSPALLADVEQRRLPTFPEPFPPQDLLAAVAAALGRPVVRRRGSEQLLNEGH